MIFTYASSSPINILETKKLICQNKDMEITHEAKIDNSTSANTITRTIQTLGAKFTVVFTQNKDSLNVINFEITGSIKGDEYNKKKTIENNINHPLDIRELCVKINAEYVIYELCPKFTQANSPDSIINIAREYLLNAHMPEIADYTPPKNDETNPLNKKQSGEVDSETDTQSGEVDSQTDTHIIDLDTINYIISMIFILLVLFLIGILIELFDCTASTPKDTDITKEIRGTDAQQ